VRGRIHPRGDVYQQLLVVGVTVKHRFKRSRLKGQAMQACGEPAPCISFYGRTQRLEAAFHRCREFCRLWQRVRQGPFIELDRDQQKNWYPSSLLLLFVAEDKVKTILCFGHGDPYFCTFLCALWLHSHVLRDLCSPLFFCVACCRVSLGNSHKAKYRKAQPP
jgi:hypothetical protein